jgi:hypothetical protein
MKTFKQHWELGVQAMGQEDMVNKEQEPEVELEINRMTRTVLTWLLGDYWVVQQLTLSESGTLTEICFLMSSRGSCERLLEDY